MVRMWDTDIIGFKSHKVSAVQDGPVHIQRPGLPLRELELHLEFKPQWM